MHPSEPAAHDSLGRRVVRVFVSSTFRDMVAERDELVRRVFPALRELCEERGVTWGEVDLRWGITDQQVREGQMLPLCLDEIDLCRPFFIGLLGDQYGRLPDEIPNAIVEREPWLATVRDRSITELEILHGVLNDPASAAGAFFYLRAPAAGGSTPSGAKQLRSLKDRIRASGVPVREDYSDPRSLGELVLADLRAMVESLFPAGSEPDVLERELALHDAYARQRTELYIGRPEYLEALDAHADGDGPPLIVVGESGGGKSALLANWTVRRRDSPDTSARRARERPPAVITHFVGASPDTASAVGLLFRLTAELNREVGLGLDVPDTFQRLRFAFNDALYRGAAARRVILVIDGVDRLVDQAGALNMSWLPQTIPRRVRLVLSAPPGPALDALVARGWPTLELSPMNRAERLRLIEGFLRPYGKHLAPDQLERVADAEQCASPMFLRLMLDELRVHPHHETLERRLEVLLGTTSIAGLYDEILARWETDFERDRPGMVRDAMTRLWAARRGLTEEELRDQLGTEARPLPAAFWSPLRIAARQTIVTRSGLIGFAHDHARAAVQRRYLPAEDDRRSAHDELANYFAAPSDPTPRKLEELPWQLAEAGDWDGLHGALADPTFVAALDAVEPVEVRRYWALLEAQSGFRLADTYEEALTDPAHHDPDALSAVSRLLRDGGYREEAIAVSQALESRYRGLGDSRRLADAVSHRAVLLQEGGRLEEALSLSREAERICREIDDQPGLAREFANQAVIFEARGDLDRALALEQQSERIYRALGHRPGVAGMLGNQALIFKRRGDLEKALDLLRQTEQICHETGDQRALSISLGNQATILRTQGDLDGALKLHDEEEQICRAIGSRQGLRVSLMNRTLILRDLGDLDGALAIASEQEQLCRERGDRAGLQHWLGVHATLLNTRDPEASLALANEREAVCRDLGNQIALANAIANQASALNQLGDVIQANLRIHTAMLLASRYPESSEARSVIEISRQVLSGPPRQRKGLRSWLRPRSPRS